jgi:hypothetical protein
VPTSLHTASKQGPVLEESRVPVAGLPEVVITIVPTMPLTSNESTQTVLRGHT